MRIFVDGLTSVDYRAASIQLLGSLRPVLGMTCIRIAPAGLRISCMKRLSDRIGPSHESDRSCRLRHFSVAFRKRGGVIRSHL